MTPNNRFLRISENVVGEGDIRIKRHYNALFDWFKRNLEYEMFLLDNTLQYTLKQREVHEVDFGRNIGSELNERHYAVVLHNSDENAQNIVVVPLTTKIHYGYGEAIDLGFLPNVNTNERSYARVTQMRTIDKARIYLRPLINTQDNRCRSEAGPVTMVSEEQFKLIISGINKLVNNRL